MAQPSSSGAKGLAKRLLAPFERRIEHTVQRAVETAMQQESAVIRDALRADVATLVELTYDLQRQLDARANPGAGDENDLPSKRAAR